MLLLRILHIVAGVYWAGAVFFFVTFLEPSLRDTGPDGGKVMGAMIRRGYMTAMPIMALITILSGIDLMRRVSGNFAGEWFATRPGMTLSTGAVAAVLALLIGVVVMRPTAVRIGALAAEAQGLDGPARESRMAEAGALRDRARVVGRGVALLLVVSVVAMAAARYL